mmetsp:Transcript_111036/g.247950  ORF Transcript_111036/g.247950 Transcript_111036/m.247950 type:complete len:687 (-) Transcript_111036:170-2230(-)
MADEEEEAPLEDPEQARKNQAPKTCAVGIDLGTTYSCVGIYRDGEVQIIANDQGNRTTPSYVAWTDEERLLGDSAKNQVASNPTNTVFDAKRLIGRRWDDPIVQADIKLWPFKVVSDGSSDDKPLIEVYYQGVKKQFHPEEVSSMVLTKMKNTAESFIGTRCKEAVITVPAYFNDSQRQATKDAGEIAGLQVLRIVNEPTAAAIAYGLDRPGKTEKEKEKAKKKETNILVFDMGGGTFDVSILNITDSVFEVRATAGDPHLGGEDFDNRLLSHCISEFRRKFNSDPTRNQRAIRRLRTQCERAKRQLSSQTQVTVEVDSLHEGNDFSLRISRAKFEELCIDFFKKAMDPVTQCLTDSGMSKSMIEEIVMVGGSTRIPKVQELICAFFNGKQLCKSINPDEAVAYGAAVQAAIVSGTGTQDVQNMLLLDVAPLSLGLEMSGGMMEKLIERNSTIPTHKSKDFTTAEDNQEYVDINVYEGERTMVHDNNFLGKFTLKGIPKTLRGVPKIKVTFNINSEGLLSIEAKDTKNNLSGAIEIQNEKGRLSQREIERMLSDAETFKQSDSMTREEMVARESLKGYMARLRKSMGDFDEEKMGVKDRERLMAKFTDTERWLKETGDKSTKQECEEKQKEVEAAWNIIMIKVNQAVDDFWDQQVDISREKMVLVEHGGFFVKNGFDLRELIDEPD